MSRSSEPLIDPAHTYATVSDKIASIVLTRKTPAWWFIGAAIAFNLVLLLHYAIGMLFLKGVGVWGLNIPVGWAFDITNFVWWIGIGHAGTLISAILLLLHQPWRTSINRFAEAMTLFAVSCAGIFPAIHVGRPWKAYYLFPYPDTMGLWPQFRSPLVWDVVAVSTYATVSALFWFVGLIPDLATLRDRAQHPVARVAYGFFAMGWRGASRHWHRYQSAYVLLAGLATPLVVSVHTVVSWDFAVSLIPGWHTTIFPPYFVAGAVFSGFAMVLTLTIPLRAVYGLKDLITDRHLDLMAKVMLATGLMVAYGYVMEIFIGWYGGHPYEKALLVNRTMGPYAPAFWALILCNIAVPQALWFPRVRRHTLALFAISIVVNIGMWLERFVIIVISLHRDFLPSSWGMFHPTFFDFATMFGAMGLFLAMIFIFIRGLPMISIFEARELLHEARTHPGDVR